MGLFNKKDDNGIVKTSLTFVDGINNFDKDMPAELTLDKEDKSIFMKHAWDNLKPEYEARCKANLRVDKIDKIDIVNESEIITQQKSVGRRAILGGLILGPLGSIVGGMTGLNNKKRKDKRYVVINYSGDKVLSFEVPESNVFSYSTFVYDVKSLMTKTKEYETEL